MAEDCKHCTKKKKVQIDLSPYVTMISPKPNFDGESKGAIEYCSIGWFLTLTKMFLSFFGNSSFPMRTFYVDLCFMYDSKSYSLYFWFLKPLWETINDMLQVKITIVQQLSQQNKPKYRTQSRKFDITVDFKI